MEVYKYYRGIKNNKGTYSNPFVILHENHVKKYVVMKIVSKKRREVSRILIDYRDLKDVLHHNWYKLKNGYVQTTSEPKTYLHRLIMQKYRINVNNYDYIDHINRNPLDNRLCNLRYATQSDQNRNQNKKERIDDHPLKNHPDVKPNEIPKYIWYKKPRSAKHGDCFAVEKHPNIPLMKGQQISYIFMGNLVIKTVSDLINTTSNKSISLIDKLNEAILIKEALGPVPHNYNNNGEMDENSNRLLEEYQNIVNIV